MKAKLINNITAGTFDLWWIQQSDGSDLPIPQTQVEIISRLGLDHAVRKIGKFGGGKLTARTRTDVTNRQAAETILANLQVAQDAFTPLELQIQRPDGTWFEYDSVNVRFLIVSERDSQGIVFNTRNVLAVVGGYTTFPAGKIIVDIQLNLLPVLI